MTAETWAPACMEPEDLADWQRFNRGLNAGMKASSPCADCLTAYADEMRVVGRCNGIPRGDSKEEKETVSEPVTIAPRSERIPVALVLPCGGCAHQPVCRIAPTLEGLTTARTDLPDFDPAVSLEMVARVECGHFVKGRARQAEEAKPGRKLNLSPEERERRRQRILAMNTARGAAESA